MAATTRCARGSAVARALRVHRAEATWECSDIGGHRFPATLIAFPHGLCYYGRLSTADAIAVAQQHERGEISLQHLRGRAGDPWEVQAAEYFARRLLDLRSIEDILTAHHPLPGEDTGRVRLDLRGGEAVMISVQRRPTGQPHDRCAGPAKYDPGRVAPVSATWTGPSPGR